MTTSDKPPQFIGFGDGNPSGDGSESIRELLHAARASILPAARRARPVDETPPPAPDRRIVDIADDIAKIADALRHGGGFNRLTAAAALDRLRQRLGSL